MHPVCMYITTAGLRGHLKYVYILLMHNVLITIAGKIKDLDLLSGIDLD